MKKRVYLLSCLLLLSAGLAICSCNSDDPSEHLYSHQNETPLDSILNEEGTSNLSSYVSKKAVIGKWKLYQDGRGVRTPNSIDQDILEIFDNYSFCLTKTTTKGSSVSTGVFSFFENYLNYNDTTQMYWGYTNIITENYKDTETIIHECSLSITLDTLILSPYEPNVVHVMSPTKWYSKVSN